MDFYDFFLVFQTHFMFSFFSEDFDSAMTIRRVRMENPDANDLDVKKMKKPKKSGRSLSDHQKICSGNDKVELVEDVKMSVFRTPHSTPI